MVGYKLVASFRIWRRPASIDFAEEPAKQHQVNIVYRDDRRRHTYSDAFVLDIEGLNNVRLSDRRSMHSLVGEVEKINKQLAKFLRART